MFLRLQSKVEPITICKLHEHPNCHWLLHSLVVIISSLGTGRIILEILTLKIIQVVIYLLYYYKLNKLSYLILIVLFYIYLLIFIALNLNKHININKI